MITKKLRPPYARAYEDLLKNYKSLEVAYDTQNTRYREQLVKTATLQAQIDDLEPLIHFYRTVDSKDRKYLGAV